MKEHTWILDPASGALVIEGLTAADTASLAGDLLPPPHSIGCARPLSSVPLPIGSDDVDGRHPHLRVASVYHGSVIDGPGRRSVCQMQGCSLGCPGCHVPQTHDPRGGVSLSVLQVLTLLVDPAGEPRDGVTITGGEPFDQPYGLLRLLEELKTRDLHTAVFTGYTLEVLARRSDSAVRQALSLIDILVDGPFVAALAERGGAWRGSGNQRLIMNPLAHVDTRATVRRLNSEQAC